MEYWSILVNMGLNIFNHVNKHKKMSSHLVRVKEAQDCYDQLDEEEQTKAERKLKS